MRGNVHGFGTIDHQAVPKLNNLTLLSRLRNSISVRCWRAFLIVCVCWTPIFCYRGGIAIARPVRQAGTVPSNSFVTAINNMKRSIAPVLCFDNVSNGPISLRAVDGTAFFLSTDGLFLTPAHVIRDFLPGGGLASCSFAAVAFEPNKWSGGTTLTLKFSKFAAADCVLDETLDLAACQTKDDLTKGEWKFVTPRAVQIDPVIQDDGTPIAFTGFPLFSHALPLSSVGSVAAYAASLNGEVGPPFGIIVIDKTSWPGSSGSPIYLMNGHVVGMMAAMGSNAAEGTGYGRSSTAISAFLKAHPETRAYAPNEQSSQSRSPHPRH